MFIPNTIIAKFHTWDEVIFKRIIKDDNKSEFYYIPTEPNWDSEFWMDQREFYEQNHQAEYEELMGGSFTFEDFIDDTIMEHYLWDVIELTIDKKEILTYDPNRSWFKIIYEA